jgi:hypothetical protein
VPYEVIKEVRAVKEAQTTLTLTLLLTSIHLASPVPFLTWQVHTVKEVPIIVEKPLPPVEVVRVPVETLHSKAHTAPQLASRELT